MSEQVFHVVDVSGYQPPNRVPWNDARIDGGIVKLTEGTTPSKGASYHVPAIRAAGKALGVYHFFRPDEPPMDQYMAFRGVADAAGYGVGDIVPAVDIERCITRGKWTEAAASWNDGLQVVCQQLARRYGDALVYCNQSTWIQLGRPKWLLTYLLWVPYVPLDGHGAFASCSLTPGGKPWTIWQKLWGPLFLNQQDSKSPIGVDQNDARELPRIERIDDGIQPRPWPSPPNPGTVRMGDGAGNGKSGDVRILQRYLRLDGLALGTAIVADGEFGELTRAAVLEVQGAKGLVADGVCGDRTWGVLFSMATVRPPTRDT